GLDLSSAAYPAHSIAHRCASLAEDSHAEAGLRRLGAPSNARRYARIHHRLVPSAAKLAPSDTWEKKTTQISSSPETASCRSCRSTCSGASAHFLIRLRARLCLPISAG